MKRLPVTFSLLVAPLFAWAQGSLENPANNSTESGIGILSGWHCTASRVEALIDGKSVGFAYVGSERGDTVGVCGKSNTGFALLLNFNELPRGAHKVQIFANGVKFGEANFSTTQSGGKAFLTGASKQVIVSDFPTAGSNATLTWSQSKQSFVVTSVSTGTTTPTTTGIAKLYGNVVLNYRFNNTTTVYTDRVAFSASNLDPAGSGAVSASLTNRSAAIGCVPLLTAGLPEFTCAITNPSGSLDAFLIDVSSTGAISGTYEYCLSTQSTQSCAEDLLYTPDGVVTGTVSRSTIAALSSLAGVEDTGSAASGKDRDKLATLREEGNAVITTRPAPEAAQVVNQALRALGVGR